jgi:hypothetical protein
MTLLTTLLNIIILNKPEDWEQWLWQLRALVDQQIWAYVDLATEAPQEGLLEKPPYLKVIDFNKNATLYI